MNKALLIWLCLAFLISLPVLADEGKAGHDEQQGNINTSFIVGEGGAVSITASDRILLKPGTKVSAGGTLKATIVKSDIKSIKKKKRERPLEVSAREEAKIVEHARMEMAFNLFRTFATPVRSVYRAEKEREAFTLQDSHVYGLTSQQQQRLGISINTILPFYHFHFNPEVFISQTLSGHRPIAVLALRL